MSEARFTIERGHWLAFTCYTGEPGGVHPSPIRVDSINVMSGARAIELGFLHLAYPAGAQNKRYRLRTLKRTRGYYAAEQIGGTSDTLERLIVLEHLTPTWLAKHFPHLRQDVRQLFDELDRPQGDSFIRLYGSTY